MFLLLEVLAVYNLAVSILKKIINNKNIINKEDKSVFKSLDHITAVYSVNILKRNILYIDYILKKKQRSLFNIIT